MRSRRPRDGQLTTAGECMSEMTDSSGHSPLVLRYGNLIRGHDL